MHAIKQQPTRHSIGWPSLFPQSAATTHVSCVLQVVLTVIENQTLVWLGTGMAPLLPILGALANILHFYTQKLLAMHLYAPPEKAFSASRTSTIAHGIMLGAHSLPLTPALPLINHVSTVESRYKGVVLTQNPIHFELSSDRTTFD